MVKNTNEIDLDSTANVFTFSVRNIKDYIYVGIWYREINNHSRN